MFELIQKPIDHNTTYTYIDRLKMAFFDLFDRIPILYVTGNFVELKTGDIVFANMDKCEVLKQRKTSKPIFAMFDVDGENCKATIEDQDQCILVLK